MATNIYRHSFILLWIVFHANSVYCEQFTAVFNDTYTIAIKLVNYTIERLPLTASLSIADIFISAIGGFFLF